MNPLQLLKDEKIYLASASPRRQQLLKIIGLKFKVIPSNIEENIGFEQDPQNHVLTLSHAKALAVAEKISSGLVIGADTIVVLDHRILGKPTNEMQALQMLRTLSGRNHLVYTGFSLIAMPAQRSISDFEITTVHFRELTDWEIENYVLTGNPMDKAGAYGIQDQSALFADRIEGCFYNVVGFPLTKFYLTLQNFLSENYCK